ncbi:hypothetical protein BU17DRAFT_48019 [Hysterangium stoloniferum]|nr:hypothetical protein BU17DRAFT_48019 [Hysterangium stoloniferum]
MTSLSVSEPQYPALPPINGEHLLNVYTHKSLRMVDGSGDNERYAVLGEKVFEAEITYYIFTRHPTYDRKEIEAARLELLSASNYVKWANHYKLREKLRYNQSAFDEIHSHEGAREIFHAHVGGVYSQENGPMTVNCWVYNLVVPPDERKDATGGSLQHQQPPPPTPHVTTLPLHLPKTHTAYLPRFNEMAMKRRLDVQWRAEQGGLQHSPRWNIGCIVNGKLCGNGSATTKQLAKEEAAKQAFQSLGFQLPGY